MKLERLGLALALMGIGVFGSACSNSVAASSYALAADTLYRLSPSTRSRQMPGRSPSGISVGSILV